MHTYLQRLTDERDSLTLATSELADKAAAEDRDFTDTEQTSIRSWQERCAQIDAQLVEYNGSLESQRAYASLQSKLTAPEPAPNGNGNGRRAQLPVEERSWGELFTGSEQFRSYGGYGQSGRVELPASYLETRAVITTANLAIPHFIAPPIEQQFVSVLLELVNRVQVSSGVVDWVEIGPDPVAAVVAEGSAKPEATVTFTPKTAALDTLAHWVQITRQALSDTAYIQSLLEGKLRRGLLAKMEADLATAIDAAATQTNAGATGRPLIESLRQGIGKVQAAGYSPNAVLLNPTDFASLDISVMGLTVAGPTLQSSFWGLRPVASASIPAGKAYVGDFRAAVSLFDRGVTSVFVSDSHAALFISNVLVILAEARVKSVVDEPLAICECTVT